MVDDETEVNDENSPYGVMDHGSRNDGTFLGRLFGGTINEKYCSENNPGFESYFVRVGEEIAIELMTKPRLRSVLPDNHTTGWVHLALSVGSKEQVNALAKKPRKRGFWCRRHELPAMVTTKP